MEAERGSILVSVLALAALLAVLAGVASNVVWAAFGSSHSFADRIRAEVAARAALEQLMGDSADFEQLASGASITLGTVEVAATAEDESARVDLNRAPLELIAGVFRVAGADAGQARTYAARVIDWRDEDNNRAENGAERDDYRSAGRVDVPTNGPLVHVAELGRVLGIPPAIAGAAAPYFTVASKLDRFNPLIADPTLLLALPNVDAGKARDFIRARETLALPFEKLVARLGPVEKYVTQDRSSAARVDISVALGSGSTRRFQAVIAAGRGNEPYRVVSWEANPVVPRRDAP